MDAVIYVRVSHDKKGQGRSVEEQESECREVCADNGWTVREPVIKDNSIGASRYSRAKSRPGFDSLPNILRRGDVLVVWASDRAGRKMEDHLVLRDMCEQLGVIFCAGGQVYDFYKTADRARAGHEAIDAEQESSRTRDRVVRAVKARANKGDAHGALPFGYVRTFDPVTGERNWHVDPVAAQLIRDAVETLLAGGSLYSIAELWNSRGMTTNYYVKEKTVNGVVVPAKHGQPWQGRTVRNLLKRPTLAGLRTYRGEIVGPGNWDPIITRDQHERVCAVMADPTRKGRHGRQAKHLLTNIATCSACGAGIRYMRNTGAKDKYRCPVGHVGRSAEPVDAWVIEHMFRLIDIWRDQVFFFSDDDEADAADVSCGSSLLWEQARALKQRLDALTDQAIAGTISAEQLARATAVLEPQIEAAKAKAQADTIHPLLFRLGESNNDLWKSWTIEERRSLVRAVVNITIHPAINGARKFDPATVEIVWKGQKKA